MKKYEEGHEVQQVKIETSEVSEVTAESPESPITAEIEKLKKSVMERGRLTPQEFIELREMGAQYIEVGTITASGAFRRTGALVRDPQNSNVWHLIFSENAYDDKEFEMNKELEGLIKAKALYVKDGDELAKGVKGEEGLVMQKSEKI